MQDPYDLTPAIVLDAAILAQSGFENTPPVSNINLPAGFEHLENAGNLHNTILMKLDDIRSGQVDISHIVPDPEVKKLVLSEEFGRLYDAIVGATKVAQLPSGVIDLEIYTAAGVSLPDNVTRVFSLLLEVYNQFPENEVDVLTLVNRYICVIEASGEFTNSEKEAIYAGLVIAANSPLYWTGKL